MRVKDWTSVQCAREGLVTLEESCVKDSGVLTAIVRRNTSRRSIARVIRLAQPRIAMSKAASASKK